MYLFLLMLPLSLCLLRYWYISYQAFFLYIDTVYNRCAYIFILIQ